MQTNNRVGLKQCTLPLTWSTVTRPLPGLALALNCSLGFSKGKNTCAVHKTDINSTFNRVERNENNETFQKFDEKV